MNKNVGLGGPFVPMLPRLCPALNVQHHAIVIAESIRKQIIDHSL
jgi:hypothetical protein